jgi:CHAT domain-containing protein
VVNELTPSPIREGCPEPEAIAAYVDGRLAGAEKAEMEAHLASCDDCLAVFSETARSETELGGSQAPPAVVRGRFGRRWILLAVAACLVVAAAVPLALRMRSNRRVRPELAELVAALGPQRLFEPRLTGGFEFGPMAPRYRSAKPLAESDSWEVLAAAAKIRKKDEQKSTPATLDALGAANLLLGKYDDAVSKLEEATLEEPKNARYLTDLSAAYLVRAKEKGRADDYPKALESAEKAAELDPSILEAWFNGALALDELHLKGEAIKAWSRYLNRDSTSPWAREAMQHRDALVAQPNHSNLWIREKPLLLAAAKSADPRTTEGIVRSYSQETRELMEREILPSWAGSILAGRTSEAAVTLGAAKFLSSAYSSATGDLSYQAAISEIDGVVRAGGDNHEIAVGVDEFRRAWAFYEAEDIDNAVDHFERSRDILASRSRALSNLGALYRAVCHYYQGHFDEANGELRPLSISTERYGEISLSGYASWLIGAILDRAGHFGESIAYYRRALARLETTGAFGDCANLHSLIAQDLNSLGEPRASWEEGLQSLTRADWLSDPDRRHTLYEMLSLIALTEGHPRAALHFAQTASAAESLGTTPSVRAESRMFLARIHSLLGHFAAARADITGAQGWVDKVPGEAWRRRMAADLLAARVEAGSTPDHRSAIDALTRSLAGFANMRDNFPIARLLLERGRLFRADGRPRLAAGDFESGIQNFEQRRSRQAGHELSYFDRSETLFEEMVSLQEMDLRSADRALEYVERLKARSLLDTVPDAADTQARPLPVAEIRSSLKADERLIYFAALPDRLLSWIVSPARGRILHVSTRVSQSELSESVRRVRGDCMSPRGRGFPGAAESLMYNLLVRPLASEVRTAKTLIIIADSTLAPLPFAALFDSGTGRFLFEDHRIILCPSGSYFRRTRMKMGLPEDGTLTAFIIGDPLAATDEIEDLGVLPHAEEEAVRIADMYPQSEVLTGKDATSHRFLDEAGSFDILHFAGHAVVSPEYPDRSHLVLARTSDGGRGDLFPGDVVRARFPKTRLAVLSACSTADGHASPGEGMLSLARSFLTAGINDVVASLWDVDDEQSQALMTAFHRALLRYRDPVLSLQSAQEEALREAKDDTSSAGGWAAFEVFGTIPRRDGAARAVKEVTVTNSSF